MARLEKGMLYDTESLQDGTYLCMIEDANRQSYFDVLSPTDIITFDRSETIEGYSQVSLARFVIKRLINANSGQITFWRDEQGTVTSEQKTFDAQQPTEQMSLY